MVCAASLPYHATHNEIRSFTEPGNIETLNYTEKRSVLMFFLYNGNTSIPSFLPSYYRDYIFVNDTLYPGENVNQIFKRNSYNTLKFTGNSSDLVDVYPEWIPYNSQGWSCESLANVSTWDTALTKHGVKKQDHDHYIISLNPHGCRLPWGGWTEDPLPNKNIYMGMLPRVELSDEVNTYIQASYAHELGHSLGFYHSGSSSCGFDLVVNTTSCNQTNYGNTLNIMVCNYAIDVHL